MAYLTKAKVTEILRNAPPGTTPQGIIAVLREKGHTLEGYEESQSETFGPVIPPSVAAQRGVSSSSAVGPGKQDELIQETLKRSSGPILPQSIAEQRGSKQDVLSKGVESGKVIPEPTQQQLRTAETERLKGEGILGRAQAGLREGMEAAEETRQTAKRAFDRGETIQGLGLSAGSILQSGVLPPSRAVGEVISPVFDFLGETFTSGVKSFEDTKIAKDMRKLGISVNPQQQQQLQKNVAELAKAFGKIDPETRAKGKGALRTVEALLELTGFAKAEKPVQKGVTKALDVAEDALLPIKTAQQAKRASSLRKIAGEIVQGEVKDKASAVRALREIDLKGIKSIKDLESRLGTKTKQLLSEVDKQLDVDTSPLKPEQMIIKKTIDGETVEENFVKKAIEQLDELSNTSTDLELKAKLKAWKKKLNNTGLTRKEINDIARVHGAKRSGFNLNSGAPSTSVNKQGFENVRTGLKETVRNLAPQTAELDKAASDLIKTQELLKKLQKSANKLEQKVKKRGLGESVGRAMANIANQLSLGTLKGGVTALIPSNVGYKQLNSLELSKQIPKLLKQFDKALEATTDEAIKKALKDL